MISLQEMKHPGWPNSAATSFRLVFFYETVERFTIFTTLFPALCRLCGTRNSRFNAHLGWKRGIVCIINSWNDCYIFRCLSVYSLLCSHTVSSRAVFFETNRMTSGLALGIQNSVTSYCPLGCYYYLRASKLPSDDSSEMQYFVYKAGLIMKRYELYQC